MKRNILLIVIDLGCAAALILAVWIVGYKIPQGGIKAQTSSGLAAVQNIESEESTESGSDVSSSSVTDGNPASTKVKLDTADWRTKFADKFTDTVVTTSDSYTSPDIAIFLTRKQYDTGITDITEQGKHRKYGTKISYVLADIYIADISCLQTAFAQDTYGVGYSEKLSSIADRLGAVLAVNGDSYNNNRNRNNGTIIRNGVVYRAAQTDTETCVLNWDGTMQIYQPGTVDINTLIENGAYQSWVFGPSLLTEDGEAKTDFLTRDYLRESHPRTAIGYYEPGHYCLLLVDGRQTNSRGMFLTEMSKLFADLGCKAAYNLDGGHCSFMYFNGDITNNPYKPEHRVSDGIILKNISNEEA